MPLHASVNSMGIVQWIDVAGNGTASTSATLPGLPVTDDMLLGYSFSDLSTVNDPVLGISGGGIAVTGTVAPGAANARTGAVGAQFDISISFGRVGASPSKSVGLASPASTADVGCIEISRRVWDCEILASVALAIPGGGVLQMPQLVAPQACLALFFTGTRSGIIDVRKVNGYRLPLARSTFGQQVLIQPLKAGERFAPYVGGASNSNGGVSVLIG